MKSVRCGYMMECGCSNGALRSDCSVRSLEHVTAGRCFVGTRMASAGAGMAKTALLEVDGTVRGRWMWDDVVEGALPTE